MDSSVIIGLLIVIILILLYRLAQFGNNKIKAELKEQYELALKSGDKRKALEAGRKYYAKLRGGKLTIQDEQAIANDMKTAE